MMNEQAALLQGNRQGGAGCFIPGVPKLLPLSNTIFGQRRRVRDIAKKEWVLPIIAVLTALLMIGFSSHRIHELRTNHQPLSSEVVMIVSELFCLYYICHGVIYERPQEILIYLVAIFLDVCYCTYDFIVKHDYTTYPIARLVLDWSLGFAVPLTLCGCLFGLGYWRDQNRLIARITQSADLAQQRDLRRIFWLNSILVLDLQFAASSVIFIVTDRQVDAEEIVALIVGGLVNLGFFIAGKWAIRREEHRGTFIFLILGSFPILFLLYKAVKQRDGLANKVYLDIASTLFSSISVLIRGVILYLSYQITKRYGNGLRQRIFEEPQQRTQTAGDGPQPQGAPVN